MDLLPVIETDFIDETPEALKEESESDDEPIVKETIEQSEIFVDKPTPQIKLIVEDIVEEPIVPVEPVETIKPIKPIKKKRVMSQQQLDCLKKGREKALLVRQANALEKKKMKDLQSKKKQKEKKELEDYVNDVPVVPVAPVIIEKHTNTMMPSQTEEQIEERTQRAIKKALQEHEAERQVRKAKKVANLKLKKEHDKITDMCVNASLYTKQPSKYGDNDFFDNCWN